MTDEILLHLEPFISALEAISDQINPWRYYKTEKGEQANIF